MIPLKSNKFNLSIAGNMVDVSISTNIMYLLDANGANNSC